MPSVSEKSVSFEKVNYEDLSLEDREKIFRILLLKIDQK